MPLGAWGTCSPEYPSSCLFRADYFLVEEPIEFYAVDETHHNNVLLLTPWAQVSQ
jgi:hypothetical protein